ncbi:MAG: hypothetical protein HKN18_01025 [Silicimonas sp.]|nr:hypothetical protein [Silicimonas sp.]
MEHDGIAQCFTGPDGAYRFARWGRPIVPVVFGVEDATLSVIKGAIEAVVALAGHKMAETDPELGANLMMFFFRDWQELVEVPDLDRLIPDLQGLVQRLEGQGANQYRLFRFDEAGAIKAAFVFVRMEAETLAIPAEDLALSEAAKIILLWSSAAFAKQGPLVKAGDHVVLRPDIAGLIRAGYDAAMPVMAKDASHALRLAARVDRQGQD